MGAGIRILAALLALLAAAGGGGMMRCAAQQLSATYYDTICPGVEKIVRDAVTLKVQQTPVAVGATVRLFFHDCFVQVRPPASCISPIPCLSVLRSPVALPLHFNPLPTACLCLCGTSRVTTTVPQGCDASVIIVSSGNNTSEKDNPANKSLAGDGFDTVIQAKAAVDAVPQCANQVSCADILTMATRDVIALAGGPEYPVELGRLDGLSSTSASVDGNLPPPSFNLDQLTAIFAANNLSQADMVALSAAHTVGFAHCGTFADRIQPAAADPTMDPGYGSQLLAACPPGVDVNVAVDLDPETPKVFDNQYFINLQKGMGLLGSDQVLYADVRSRPLVDNWAANNTDFLAAFAAAMTNLGRVGVKTDPALGNIRRDCAVLNG
ncbi:peroxidase 35 isoform X1 [Lolium perenne]|uniref:peroxidase 35 isoform X1 n=1 Tax=Lolium perenne TaxID=4522 RepID=UPI0021F5B1BB|nr:peroxidase 35-like isoform X1 [Lolium perenne]